VTWEWVVLIIFFGSVAMHLLTKHYDSKESPHAPELQRLWDAMGETLERVHKVEVMHENMQRLADETQKMLSQANLAKGLRPIK
jgi:hypothetical protein